MENERDDRTITKFHFPFSILHFWKRDAFASLFSLSKKYYFNFHASCGSTHKIEFAKQIHKFREHVSRNLYKGRKNVPVGRGFSSVFARKRGFEREAARKTIVFRQPHKRRLFRRLLSFTVFFRCNRNDKWKMHSHFIFHYHFFGLPLSNGSSKW